MKVGYKFTIVAAGIASIFLLTFVQFGLKVAISQDEKPFPVLLLHSWNSDASIWSDWIDELNKTGIYAEAVKFGDDDPVQTEDLQLLTIL